MESITRIGMVGLGRMGANMTERLRKNGIEVVGYDVNPDVRDVASLEELVSSMEAGKRAVWLMLPLFAYESTLDELYGLLSEGDVLIDGGNTRWQVTQERAARFATLGVHYIDVGTSGGVWGLAEGYAVMVGASEEEFEALRPVLEALAPGEDGIVHAGTSGAGHYTKEIHNGIEYGMMAALGEGFELLSAEKMVKDPAAVLASWRHGSVVRSWLLDLAVRALEDKEGFANVEAVAPDSGEGRWTVEDAIRLGVSTPVIASALFARFASQKDEAEGLRLVAALRNQFGGHAVVRREAH